MNRQLKICAALTAFSLTMYALAFAIGPKPAFAPSSAEHVALR